MNVAHMIGEVHTDERGQGQLGRHPAELGLELRLVSRLVTGADDLVILCDHAKAEEALEWMRKIMGKLKLAANEEKARI